MSLFRRLFGGNNNRLKAKDIVGNVIIGDISGISYQIYNGGPLPEPPRVTWDELPPAGAPYEYMNLLSWRCRLALKLIGRDAEAEDLANWACNPKCDIRIRFLTGPGGAGKTRLAAEVAEKLAKEGWHAGFTPLEQSKTWPISKRGLFLLMDYPEAWREQVRGVLRDAADKGAPPGPVRILFLSRRPMSEWSDDILQSRADRCCDAQEVKIGKLRPDLALAVFKDAAGRLAKHRGKSEPSFDDGAIKRWFRQNGEVYGLPLLLIAGAVHFVDFPENTLALRAGEVVGALAKRERTQLNRIGKNAGWDEEAAARLVGLAALREGLDEAALKRLANRELGLGLPAPAKIADAVNRNLGQPGNKGLTAPGPDILAAELLRQVLEGGGERGPEWVWATLAEPEAIQVELLDRRIHDSITLHGASEGLISETLIKAVAGRAERAAAWDGILCSEAVSFRLGVVGIAIARTLLKDTQLDTEARALLLNNLSNQLSDLGDTGAALDAIREAVKLRRRLAAENPARFNPDLAHSLNNLSLSLSDAGDAPAALAAIREAVEIYRRLAAENPARFNPDLAGSLNNLAGRLRDARDAPAALATIREAVEIYRGLADENPARFGPLLEQSLRNLSILEKRHGGKS